MYSGDMAQNGVETLYTGQKTKRKCYAPYVVVVVADIRFVIVLECSNCKISVNIVR